MLGLPVVFFFGGFLESRTFRSLFNNFEEIVIQIPVFKSIYITICDFSSLFSNENKGELKQVVLVNLSPCNGQQIGFITVSDFEELLHTFIADDPRLPYFCHSVIRWVEPRSNA